MGNDQRGLSFASGNKIAKFPVVRLYVGLAGTDFLALEPKGSEIEGKLTLLRELVLRAMILRNEHTDNPDAASGFDRFDEIVHRHIRNFVTVVIVALVSNGLTAAVR